MSDRKNQSDFQDYLDLLDEYGDNKTEAVSLASKNKKVSDFLEDEAKPAPKSEKPKKPISENSTDEELANADFFSDYQLDKKEGKANGEIFGNPVKIGAPPIIKNAEIVDVDEDFENISSEKKKEKNPFKRISAWFKNLPKKKKIVVSIIAAILALILILSAVAGVFVMQKLSLIGDNSDNPLFEDDEIVYTDEPLEDIEIDIGSAGFKQSLIDWATTGNDKHMSSKNVINVLLIGADSRSGRNEGNTDVMMLVSVNRKTKQMKLVSFLRDSYLYIEGDNSSYCTKLNAAYSMGGPECLIETIENNYKISIDNYVMVNFKSFKKIVDAMGGINVDVKAYEANYISNNHDIDMPVGENVTLNGEQALIFARIRKCDSDGDVSRTRRQRQIIDSMVNRVINSSVSDINKYIDVFLPYVDTGYSKSQLISLGLKAITGGWAKYERTQISMPSEDCRTSGSANMWIWVVDYQKAAHDLQIELYGESNIILPETRVTMIDVYRGASYTGSNDTPHNKTETKAPETTKKPAKPDTSKNNDATDPVTDSKEDKPLNNITTTQPQTTSPIEPTQQETEAPETIPVETQEQNGGEMDNVEMPEDEADA